MTLATADSVTLRRATCASSDTTPSSTLPVPWALAAAHSKSSSVCRAWDLSSSAKPTGARSRNATTACVHFDTMIVYTYMALMLLPAQLFSTTNAWAAARSVSAKSSCSSATSRFCIEPEVPTRAACTISRLSSSFFEY